MEVDPVSTLDRLVAAFPRARVLVCAPAAGPIRRCNYDAGRRSGFAVVGPGRAAVQEGATRMATGTVKWFNDEKGYGFITPDEGDRDLFVHHTGINGSGFKSLQENTKVSYEEESGDKGPKAVNVTKI